MEQSGKDAEQHLNAILARGAVRYTLHHGTVRADADVDADWSPAWHAVHNYLELLRRDPTRIRRCAHPACVLYFFDISPQRHPPLVLHGRLRQPRQSRPPLPALPDSD